MAVKIKRGDRRPGVTITCANGSTPVDLTVASEVRLLGKLGSTLVINRVVTGGADGKVVVETWQTADTSTAGRLLLEVQVTWSDGTIQTFPGDKYLEVDIIPDLG